MAPLYQEREERSSRISKNKNFPAAIRSYSAEAVLEMVKIKFGRKEGGKKSSADDRRRALSLAASYAPNSFGGLKEVGAALDYAISRLAREYKQNNADPRRGNQQPRLSYFELPGVA